MTFFNKKEDIMEVQLTPYGRKLLSQGELKPEYYAFFDDDILYDSGKGGFAETNSQSKTRILTETPSMRPISANFGIESNIETEYSQVIDNHMLQAIGTSSEIEKKTAGWNVIALDKEFDTFSLTSSLNSSTLAIPQINCKLEFTMSMGNLNSNDGNSTLSLLGDDLPVDPDGNYLNIQDESVVLYLMEKNGFVNSDSFEVEVFLYEEDESNLTKLHFLKQQERIVNDMLVEQEDNDMEPTKENVEYYIELLLDNQVPDEDICKGIDRLKETTIYSELDLKCPDRDEQNINIYTSTIGDVEECD
jgi:hypothetical protein